MIKRIKEIWAYRAMISSLVKRDLRGRYKGSFLGFFWSFLNPLLQLVVYTLVFSQIMRQNIDDYYMFLFVALIPWIFFSTSLSGGALCVLNQGDMLKKIYFPREVLPISFVLSQFVNMLLSFVVIFAALIIGRYTFNWIALLYLPLIMIIEFVLALGFTMILSALTVYFRDLQFIIGIVMMAWQFLTPVLYSQELIPNNLMPFFNLNPMTHVISAYRDILYYAKTPQMSTLIIAVCAGIGLFFIGWLIFAKLQKRFSEEL